MRAFAKMRSLLTDTRELARKLAALEQQLEARSAIREAAIVEFLLHIMKILDPPPPPPEPLGHDPLRNQQSQGQPQLATSVYFAPAWGTAFTLALAAATGSISRSAFVALIRTDSLVSLKSPTINGKASLRWSGNRAPILSSRK